MKKDILAEIALWLITAYRKTISPLLGSNCRFYPSCSQYSAGAFREFGFLKGAGLTLLRLARCHPFHPGGHDPIPVKTVKG